MGKYKSTNIPMCMFVCTYVYILKYRCIFIFICLHLCNKEYFFISIHKCVFECKQMGVLLYMCIFIDVCIYLYVCIFIHVYVYMYQLLLEEDAYCTLHPDTSTTEAPRLKISIKSFLISAPELPPAP
jgi:hypothetical protein